MVPGRAAPPQAAREGTLTRSSARAGIGAGTGSCLGPARGRSVRVRGSRAVHWRRGVILVTRRSLLLQRQVPDSVAAAAELLQHLLQNRPYPALVSRNRLWLGGLALAVAVAPLPRGAASAGIPSCGRGRGQTKGSSAAAGRLCCSDISTWGAWQGDLQPLLLRDDLVVKCDAVPGSQQVAQELNLQAIGAVSLAGNKSNGNKLRNGN